MFSDRRQQLVIQNNDPKGDEWFGKFFGAIVWFALFLAAVEFAYETVLAWYRDAMAWLDDTVTYVAGFWPF